MSFSLACTVFTYPVDIFFQTLLLPQAAGSLLFISLSCMGAILAPVSVLRGSRAGAPHLVPGLMHHCGMEHEGGSKG